MSGKLNSLPEGFPVHSVHECPNPMLEALADIPLKIIHCIVFPKLIR